MNYLLIKLAESFLAKKVIALLGTLNAKLVGHRSEIALAILVVLWILQGLGWVTKEQTQVLENALMGMLSITLADKVTRYAPLKEKVLEALRKKTLKSP